MQDSYARDLDLNLLRVFVAVASERSVTGAAARLYLTQPAVSAALRRLNATLGTKLFVRRGRGLALTQRGAQLYARVQPLLRAVLQATLAPPRFDPSSSQNVLRLGLSDMMEGWLLPPLLRRLEQRAPSMRVVAVPVQFRNVAEILSSGTIDLAVTIADELPPAIRREALFHSGGFVCLYDPARHRLGRRVSERDYFARSHVVVSYNADLRGVVEDALHKQRKVRCALGSFSHVGAVISDSNLLATVPEPVARYILQLHPTLALANLPFQIIEETSVELLWPQALDDDDACKFLREELGEVARGLQKAASPRRSRKQRAPRPRSKQ
jgi:LysR family transcriptional activator of mexEF-oprN operon